MDEPGFDSWKERALLNLPEPSSLLFIEYRRSFPGVKRPRREAEHSPSKAEVWTATTLHNLYKTPFSGTVDQIK
jgi:hypothetical protein